MAVLPSRHRSLILLAAVVAAQVLALAVQIKREHQGRLIRVWSVTLISPFERAGVWSIDAVRGAWNRYIGLRHTREENQRLHADLERLKLRNIELESKAAEAGRLEALAGFRQLHRDVPMVAARVIGSSADSASKTIYIDRGERDGVRRNMAVITADGVAGKIIEAYRNSAQALLITDRESGVGAMFADTRIQGPVGGTGEALLMKYVNNDEKISAGESVVTSGQDRIFPPDWPIGTVIDAKPGNPFQIVRLRPAAHLDRLEEVFVLLTTRELETRKEPEKTAAAPKPVGRPSATPPH
jgi:rod shape-determining protein MreC